MRKEKRLKYKVLMKHLIYVVGFTLLIVFSCRKEFQEPTKPVASDGVNGTDKSTNQEYDPYIILGNERKIAYSVENMQTAVDFINARVPDSKFQNLRIRQTHVYLKFLPSSENHLVILQEIGANDSIVLFSFPLHYEVIKHGSFLREDEQAKVKYAPLYATIPVGYNLPDVPYVVIERVHKPTDDESDIEVVALVMTGNEDALDITINGKSISMDNLLEYLLLTENQKSSWYYPKGKIVVWDTSKGEYVPIVNTSVLIGRLLWYYWVDVDHLGEFSDGNRYRWSVNVRANWNNGLFMIRKHWNELIGISTSDYLMELKSNNNNRTYLTKHIDDHLWYKATVSNALNKYNQNMIFKGVHGVSGSNASNFANIWVLAGNSFMGSTPMAKQYPWSVSYNVCFTSWLTWLSPVGISITTITNLLASHLYPDITLSVNDRDTKRIDQLTFHEAGHFSHAKKVNSGEFWSVFVRRELDNILEYNGDPYYDGTKPSLWSGQLIALCEGWATFTEHLNMRDYYGTNYGGYNVNTYIENFRMRTIPSSIYADNNSWFLTGLIWDILDNQSETNSTLINGQTSAVINNIVDNLSLGSLQADLSPVYNNLTSTTNNANDLKTKLLSNYPSSTNQINQLFRSYGY